MTTDDRRTTEQIRTEILAERTQLDAKLAALGAEAKRSGRIAGSVLAALGSVLLLARLRARRRSH
jgi:Flp pilus assembly protein TadB